MLLGLFFPVDLSSTLSRTAFRIPSIYLLSKALLLWTVLLLQAAKLWPSWGLLEPIGDWAAHKDMEDICWFTFTSTCLALAVGALTSGLEGLHLNHNAPFNLVCGTHFGARVNLIPAQFSFAFQLHIYSSPSTHADKFVNLPSRPSKHVILTIMLPLLQVCMSIILSTIILYVLSAPGLIPFTAVDVSVPVAFVASFVSSYGKGASVVLAENSRRLL